MDKLLIIRWGLRLTNSLRFCSSSHVSQQFQDHYDASQQQKILLLLNNATKDDLTRFSLGKNRVQKFNAFLEQHGKFDNLQQLHQVLGFGDRSFKKLCDTVLCEDSEDVHHKLRLANITVSNSSTQQLQALQNVVGLTISPDLSLSYAKVSNRFELEDWNYIPSDDTATKKVTPLSLYDTIESACRHLPHSNAFILESLPTLPPQQVYLQAYILRREAQATLLALMNSRVPQQHRVYFLRSSIVSRMYQIQVGSERVSSQPLTEQLLRGQGIGPRESCQLKYVPPELEAVYRKQPRQQREAKANALLLALSFLKLVIQADPDCHKVLKTS